mmetsp:Transcript_14943/g.37219  ORF Transcript_14943/g.37219 Transcript_14943/m.37219 type:complete len:411 (+) Transcript_14943:1607-2839(+)
MRRVPQARQVEKRLRLRHKHVRGRRSRATRLRVVALRRAGVGRRGRGVFRRGVDVRFKPRRSAARNRLFCERGQKSVKSRHLRRLGERRHIRGGARDEGSLVFGLGLRFGLHIKPRENPRTCFCLCDWGFRLRLRRGGRGFSVQRRRQIRAGPDVVHRRSTRLCDAGGLRRRSLRDTCLPRKMLGVRGQGISCLPRKMRRRGSFWVTCFTRNMLGRRSQRVSCLSGDALRRRSLRVPCFARNMLGVRGQRVSCLPRKMLRRGSFWVPCFARSMLGGRSQRVSRLSRKMLRRGALWRPHLRNRHFHLRRDLLYRRHFFVPVPCRRGRSRRRIRSRSCGKNSNREGRSGRVRPGSSRPGGRCASAGSRGRTDRHGYLLVPEVQHSVDTNRTAFWHPAHNSSEPRAVEHASHL